MQRLLGGIAAVCLIGGQAYAQQAPEKLAEDEFNKGNTAYNLGKWDEAIDHFTKAYEAMPLPEFLYNIAQSHRQAGHCKEALHFYKRFRSLKEGDKASPLSARQKDEIDRFIKQLTDCAAKADNTANTKPDGIDQPPPTTTVPAPPATTTTTTTAPPTTTATTTTATPPPPTTTTAAPTKTVATPPVKTAAVDKPGEEGEEDEKDTSVSASTTATAPELITLRAVSGIALLSSGDLDIPAQPSFAVTAGYPLAIGPMELDLGAGVSYTPLPYEVMGAQKRGMLLGARAVAAAVYPVAPKIALRGELGAGVVALSGLEMGNPLVDDRSAKSFTLLSVRAGVAADFLITPNFAATLAPGFAFSPGSSGLYGGSLREIDVLAGLEYRR